MPCMYRSPLQGIYCYILRCSNISPSRGWSANTQAVDFTPKRSHILGTEKPILSIVAFRPLQFIEMLNKWLYIRIMYLPNKNIHHLYPFVLFQSPVFHG